MTLPTLKNMENTLTSEKNRRDAYRLFAACFILPDAALTKQLLLLNSALGDLSPEAAHLISQVEESQDIEALTIDFSQLFLGPFKTLAPPYGSVYLEPGRQVMGESTADAVARYVDAGIEISSDFKDAPDHVSAELEFMYFLVYQEITAFENQDTESAIGYLQKQKSFLADHLTAWLPKFVEAIEKNANTNFYKLIAKALLVFVNQDFRDLQSKEFSSLT